MGGRGALGAALIFLGSIISELHLGERRKSAGQGVEALDEDRDISLAESNG
jgi:hypothetical protein